MDASPLPARFARPARVPGGAASVIFPRPIITEQKGKSIAIGGAALQGFTGGPFPAGKGGGKGAAFRRCLFRPDPKGSKPPVPGCRRIKGYDLCWFSAIYRAFGRNAAELPAAMRPDSVCGMRQGHKTNRKGKDPESGCSCGPSVLLYHKKRGAGHMSQATCTAKRQELWESS